MRQAAHFPPFSAQRSLSLHVERGAAEARVG